ncbi:MAG: hypothetical protein LBK60_06335 [Verrucomicrobiales bacterium]|jgi:hypothetical protein|nr:hypothetical protein [Verrucomicrobiales bacterium]
MADKTWLVQSIQTIVNKGEGATTTTSNSGTNVTIRETPAVTRTTHESGGGGQSGFSSQEENKTEHQTECKIDHQTENQSGNQTQRNNDDVGCTIAFSVEITGGLGTVPAGSEPPAPPCQI